MQRRALDLSEERCQVRLLTSRGDQEAAGRS